MKGTDADVSTYEDEFLYNLCQLEYKYGEATRCASLLEKVASTCVSSGFVSYNAKVCAIVGSIYFQKELYSKAYSFYLRANDLKSAIKAIKEVMKSGYKGEQEMFVARLCFEVLIRSYKD
jgi:hypothetical protein